MAHKLGPSADLRFHWSQTKCFLIKKKRICFVIDSFFSSYLSGTVYEPLLSAWQSHSTLIPSTEYTQQANATMQFMSGTSWELSPKLHELKVKTYAYNKFSNLWLHLNFSFMVNPNIKFERQQQLQSFKDRKNYTGSYRSEKGTGLKPVGGPNLRI